MIALAESGYDVVQIFAVGPVRAARCGGAGNRVCRCPDGREFYFYLDNGGGMIPILRFSEPFFYFLSACVAAVVCVTSLYGMRLKSGRTVYSAVSFIGSAAVIAGVLVLFYRDWMVVEEAHGLCDDVGLGAQCGDKNMHHSASYSRKRT